MPRFVVLAALITGACSHQGAIERAQTEVLRNPNEADAWVALGDAYKRDRQLDSSVSAYQRAASVEPNHPKLQGRAVGGRSPEIRELERSVLLQPDNDELWGDLGDLYAQMGDRDTARHHYQFALTIDPNDSEWQRKVMEFAADADIDAMIATLSASNNDEHIGDLADRLREMGREPEACDAYMRALLIDPGDGEWLRAIGTCEGTDALTAQLTEDALASGDDERIGNIGDLLASQGDRSAACELYEQALGIDPNDYEWIANVRECTDVLTSSALVAGRGAVGGDGPATKSASLVDQARSALALGDRTVALQHFEAALHASPTDRGARLGIMAITGTTLVALLERYSEQHPNDDELWGDLGDAYLHAGRKAEAIVAYQRAESIDPDDTEWQGNLAVLDVSHAGAQ